MTEVQEEIVTRFNIVLISCSFSLVLFMPEAGAAETEPKKELSAFERSLMYHEGFLTKESIVEVGGKKYRRIEHVQDVYYLQLLANETSASDLTVVCREKGRERFNSDSPSLLRGAVKLVRRTKLFIEGLKTVCTGELGKEKILLDPNILVGFLIDEGDPKAVLKNKRLYINPFTGALGFGAEW